MRSKRVLFAAMVAGAMILVGAYPVYRSRLRIEAKIWHWSHGHAVIVAEYEVPVPEGWLVKDSYAREGSALLVDTLVKRSSDSVANVNFILIASGPYVRVNLELWRTQEQQTLKQKGISEFREEMLKTKDEALSCVGWRELNASTRVPSAARSMQCMSPGGLFLTFVGNEGELQEIYSIISQIRRRT